MKKKKVRTVSVGNIAKNLPTRDVPSLRFPGVVEIRPDAGLLMVWSGEKVLEKYGYHAGCILRVTGLPTPVPDMLHKGEGYDISLSRLEPNKKKYHFVAKAPSDQSVNWGPGWRDVDYGEPKVITREDKIAQDFKRHEDKDRERATRRKLLRKLKHKKAEDAHMQKLLKRQEEEDSALARRKAKKAKLKEQRTSKRLDKALTHFVGKKKRHRR